MYETYYIKKKRKRPNLFSSFIPIIFLLVIGGFVGNTLIKNSETKNSTSNLKPGYIQDNSINQNYNLMQNSIENNVILSDKNEQEASDNEESSNSQSSNNKPTNEQDSNNQNAQNSNNSNNEANNNPNGKPVTFDSSVAFIGDSRTQGLIMYNGLKNVQDYSYIGLMVDTAVTKKFVQTSSGEKITLLQDMQKKNIKTVYIMLGVNELGWSYPQVFKLKYKELIEEIRKVKPDCKIYVQSIIPMTKSKSDNDKIFNNKNVAKFNQLIKEVASEENVTYLDVQSALVDSQGYLPEEASTDGIHLDVDYCKKWLNYLKNNS